MNWQQRRDELADQYKFKYFHPERQYLELPPVTSIEEHFKSGFDAGRADTLERIQPLIEALRELQTICTHDENDKDYRPLGDTYGYCSTCGTKVNYKENMVRDVLENWRKEME